MCGHSLEALGREFRVRARIYFLLERCYNFSMSIRFLLTYFMVFCLGLLNILICARMAKTFRLKYLSYYLYFLITFNITMFYGDVPENFGMFMGSNSRLIIKVGGILSALLGTPMILTAIYMFALLITGLLDQKLPRSLKIGYFIFSGGVFIGYILMTTNYIETGVEKFVTIFLGYSMKVFIIIFLSILIYLFTKTREITDLDIRKSLRVFGGLHTAIFLYVFAFTLGIKPISFLSQTLFILIIFSLHLLPLLFWKQFLKRRQMEFIPPGVIEAGGEGKDLAPFLSQYNISKRESEIVQLLLKGKNNKEIEDALFISINTVRNHVYNIYQKLGVKNRVELVNFIRNSNGRSS